MSGEKGEGSALPIPDPKLEPVSYEPHGPHGLVGPVEPNYAQKDHVRGTSLQIASSSRQALHMIHYHYVGTSLVRTLCTD